jgi:hypothetical protein
MNLQLPMIRPILLLVAILLINGCGAFFADTFSDCDANLDSIIAMLQPDLPSSAELMEQSCTPGFAPGNATLRTKFTMSPDDLQIFQQSTPIDGWGSPAPADYTYGGAAVETTSALYGEYGDGAIYTEILIDTRDPMLYTVYYSNSFID